jgi:S-methylmethionine-dependent homocysteine/selenocysteine methylase
LRACKPASGLFTQNFSVNEVRQLHREFLRAGADVMQALTFYASDDKLENRGNEAQHKYSVSKLMLELGTFHATEVLCALFSIVVY